MKQAGISGRGRGMAWAILAAILAGPVAAESVAASRAKVEMAHVALPMPDARQCWARYSVGHGRESAGMIEEVAFRVPCPEQMEPALISSLQRALQVRGYFDGAITGRADMPTRAAVQAFQRDNGFNSPVLTLDTARRLGLVPIEVSRN